jgi:hypothetical protein
MRYLIMLFIILLIPTGSFAKGECKEERKKFCQGVEKAEHMDCLKKHQAELSAQCKTGLEARIKAKEERREKRAEDSAKMGKDEGTHDEQGHGSQSENDTSKIDQPERRNPTTSNQPQPVCFDESCR